jgi:hypothetical protein
MPKAALMKTVRCGRLIALMIATATATSALAQSDPTATDRGNRLAYDASIKCFIANGVARSDAINAGKQSLADSFDSKARASFDTALKLGGVLGYSGTHINEDLGLAQANELPKMVKDISYFRDAASTCKALGLM